MISQVKYELASAAYILGNQEQHQADSKKIIRLRKSQTLQSY